MLDEISKVNKADFSKKKLVGKNFLIENVREELNNVFNNPTNLRTSSYIIDYDESNNEVYYDLVTKEDRVEVALKVSYRVLPKTANVLKGLKKQLIFVDKNSKKFQLLTQQELQVLKLVSIGLSSKQVASELYIETSTVSTHRKNINRKLEAKSCIDLYRYATAFNLIEF